MVRMSAHDAELKVCPLCGRDIPPSLESKHHLVPKLKVPSSPRCCSSFTHMLCLIDTDAIHMYTHSYATLHTRTETNHTYTHRHTHTDDGNETPLHVFGCVSQGGRALENNLVVMHRPCHDKVHAVFTEAQLARDFSTIQLLLANEDIANFAAWIRKRPINFSDGTMSLRRRQQRQRK